MSELQHRRLHIRENVQIYSHLINRNMIIEQLKVVKMIVVQCVQIKTADINDK